MPHFFLYSYDIAPCELFFATFKKADVEGKGEIPSNNFPALMKEAGLAMSEREAAAVVRIIDKDGNGMVRLLLCYAICSS